MSNTSLNKVTKESIELGSSEIEMNPFIRAGEIIKIDLRDVSHFINFIRNFLTWKRGER